MWHVLIRVEFFLLAVMAIYMSSFIPLAQAGKNVVEKSASLLVWEALFQGSLCFVYFIIPLTFALGFDLKLV